MKKSLLVLSIMLVLAITLMGCATTGDLEKLQRQENQTNLKADQALQAAQDANAAAARAENAAKMAEDRAKIAEDRAKMAEDKAEKADVIFKKSMKK
jgi:predicted Holliday junction resolvase-like endonuclease